MFVIINLIITRFIIFVLCVEKQRSKKKGDKKDALIQEPDLLGDEDEDDDNMSESTAKEGINRTSVVKEGG